MKLTRDVIQKLIILAGLQEKGLLTISQVTNVDGTVHDYSTSPEIISNAEKCNFSLRGSYSGSPVFSTIYIVKNYDVQVLNLNVKIDEPHGDFLDIKELLNEGYSSFYEDGKVFIKGVVEFSGNKFTNEDTANIDVLGSQIVSYIKAIDYYSNLLSQTRKVIKEMKPPVEKSADEPKDDTPVEEEVIKETIQCVSYQYKHDINYGDYTSILRANSLEALQQYATDLRLTIQRARTTSRALQYAMDMILQYSVSLNEGHYPSLPLPRSKNKTYQVINTYEGRELRRIVWNIKE